MVYESEHFCKVSRNLVKQYWRYGRKCPNRGQIWPLTPCHLQTRIFGDMTYGSDWRPQLVLNSCQNTLSHHGPPCWNNNIRNLILTDVICLIWSALTDVIWLIWSDLTDVTWLIWSQVTSKKLTFIPNLIFWTTTPSKKIFSYNIYIYSWEALTMV